MIYETHNGYTNYPTWAVALRISSTESLYHFFNNTASFIMEQTSDENARRKNLALSIEQMMDMSKNKTPGPLWEDIITWAKNQVNFEEIAEKILDNIEYERR